MTDQTTDTTTTDTDTSTDTGAADTGAGAPADQNAATTDTDQGGDTGDQTTALGGAGEEGAAQGQGDGDQGDGEGDDGQAGAPETYELSLKDEEGNDVALDPEMVQAADAVLRELDLSNEQANRLLPLAQQMTLRGQDSALKAVSDAGAEQAKTWLETAKAAEDIGGSNFTSTIEAAAVGLDALGLTKGTEFRELLDTSGLGNHPDMIRTFAQLGKLAGEDRQFARSDGASETKQVGWSDLYKD